MKPEKMEASIDVSLGASIREFPSDLHEAILITLIPHGKEGAYSLEIMDELNKVYQESGLRKIDMGSLYPAFKRMSKKGWIKGRWGDEDVKDEESGGARRRYYFVSNTGIAALNRLWDYRMRIKGDQVFPIPELFSSKLSRFISPCLIVNNKQQ
jgi:PadR family transcriptional regulator, regulatory protein PadR